MKKLKNIIIKNFDRFKNYFKDNIIYENNKEQVFIDETIQKFFTKKQIKFIINDNDLIISICNVILTDNKNNKIPKIGCIKTELDEVLNESNALQVTKCYLDKKEFN